MTTSRCGTVATGFVQMIQQALICPSAMRVNMSMVPGPTSSRMVPGSNAQIRSAKSDPRRTSPTADPAAPAPCSPSRARPWRWLSGQRHRSTAGPQIAPVARWRLQIALVFHVPCVLWLSPMVQHVIHSSASAIIDAAARMSDSESPVTSRDRRRRVVGEEFRHRMPALGVLGDEVVIDGTRFHQQVQQTVQQGQVCAGRELQKQIGIRGGGGAPRIHHNQLGARSEPIRHSQIQNRVAVGHVRADDEEQVGVVEVVIRPGGPSAPSDCL